MLVKPVDILLVEDNPGDVELTKEALEFSKMKNNLYIAQNGEEAMDFLYKRGKFTDAPKPDLILLDLNLPLKDGREVLQDIKLDPNFRRIPVVVLTTSESEEDVLRTYDLHANCYITKPLDIDRFIHVVKNIQEFWLSIVVLPES